MAYSEKSTTIELWKKLYIIAKKHNLYVLPIGFKSDDKGVFLTAKINELSIEKLIEFLDDIESQFDFVVSQEGDHFYGDNELLSASYQITIWELD